MLFLAFVSVVMFFVYGYLFFELLLSNIVILIIVLGIINIFVGFGLIVFGSDERKKIVVDYNKKALKALEDEYKQKGLVEMDIQELYKHECCEYDYDNNPICCVTKRMLSYKEYCFCKTPGNCRNCEAFKSALFDQYQIQLKIGIMNLK